MNESIENILRELQTATVKFLAEQGHPPTSFAFQQGAKWALERMKLLLDKEANP